MGLPIVERDALEKAGGAPKEESLWREREVGVGAKLGSGRQGSDPLFWDKCQLSSAKRTSSCSTYHFGPDKVVPSGVDNLRCFIDRCKGKKGEPAVARRLGFIGGKGVVRKFAEGGEVGQELGLGGEGGDAANEDSAGGSGQSDGSSERWLESTGDLKLVNSRPSLRADGDV